MESEPFLEPFSDDFKENFVSFFWPKPPKSMIHFGVRQFAINQTKGQESEEM